MPKPKLKLPTALVFDPEHIEEGLVCAAREFMQALKWANQQDRNADGEDLKAGSECWTGFVLDWWASAARGLLVDSGPAANKADWREVWGSGAAIKARPVTTEFLVDLLASNYPAYGGKFYSDDYWKKVFAKKPFPHDFKLALESEWGDQSSPQQNRAKVLEDAIKLVHIRAASKVIVFGASHTGRKLNQPREPGRGPEALLKDIQELRRMGGDASPWLAVCAPWNTKTKGDSWSPLAWLLTGTDTATPII